MPCRPETGGRSTPRHRPMPAEPLGSLTPCIVFCICMTHFRPRVLRSSPERGVQGRRSGLFDLKNEAVPSRLCPLTIEQIVAPVRDFLRQRGAHRRRSASSGRGGAPEPSLPCSGTASRRRPPLAVLSRRRVYLMVAAELRSRPSLMSSVRSLCVWTSTCARAVADLVEHVDWAPRLQRGHGDTLEPVIAVHSVDHRRFAAARRRSVDGL